MRCKNCGWENKQDCVVCEKCGFPLVTHIRKKTKTAISRLQTSDRFKQTVVKCPNGHIYAPSIYGDVCPFCPATLSTISTELSGEVFTRQIQAKPFLSQDKPVIGFLYSISRGGITEYWPLHLGRNTIGCSNNNGIILLESSISSSHSVIHIMRTDKLKVYIQDDNSVSGTIVNGKHIGFVRHECRNGDIIEIGNYQLYLIIIDSDEIGLKVSDKFVDKEEKRNRTVDSEHSNEQRLSRVPGETCIRRLDEPSLKISEEPLLGKEELNQRREELKRELIEGKSVVTALNGELATTDSELKIPQERLIRKPICIIDTFEPSVHQNESKRQSGFNIWERLLKRHKGYDVYGSVFAPAEVKRRSPMQVQVYLHLYEETEKVKELAQESDKNADRRDYIPLQCKLKKGDKVDVLLNIYGETLLMSDKKSVVWQGSFTKCSFDYFVPKDIDVDELSCVAMLTVNWVPVGEMRFITRIVDAPRQLNPEIIAHKYNKVFISYSHQDESKVKFLHEGLELGAVPHFFDRKYLKAGDVFPQVIQDYINSADLFILCWSENASKSEYVQKERLQALERAFPQVKPEQEAKLRIYPMSIEPRAELPGNMKENYHFGEI